MELHHTATGLNRGGKGWAQAPKTGGPGVTPRDEPPIQEDQGAGQAKAPTNGPIKRILKLTLLKQELALVSVNKLPISTPTDITSPPTDITSPPSPADIILSLLQRGPD